MKAIDLSHNINSDMETYPSDPKVSIIREKEIYNDRSLVHSFSMGTHTGTHLDTPAHIISGGKSLSSFPLSSFFGKTIKVNEESLSDFFNFNENYDGIIYETGWYKNFNNSEIFYGSNRPKIPEKLVKEVIKTDAKFFGCDLPSVDSSGSAEKPLHHYLLESNIIIYESLTNLNFLPILEHFNFFGFPLPFDSLEGSPVRAVAII